MATLSPSRTRITHLSGDYLARRRLGRRTSLAEPRVASLCLAWPSAMNPHPSAAPPPSQMDEAGLASGIINPSGSSLPGLHRSRAVYADVSQHFYTPVQVKPANPYRRGVLQRIRSIAPLPNAPPIPQGGQAMQCVHLSVCVGSTSPLSGTTSVLSSTTRLTYLRPLRAVLSRNDFITGPSDY